MVAEGDLDAVLFPQHLTGHQRVEDCGAGQRQAEIHSKQPPVLGRLVKLCRAHRKQDVVLVGRAGTFLRRLRKGLKSLSPTVCVCVIVGMWEVGVVLQEFVCARMYPSHACIVFLKIVIKKV